MTSHKQLYRTFFTANFWKTGKSLKKSVFAKHSVLGSYRVKKYLDLIFAFFWVDMCIMAQNSQNFRHFFDFCTNHERSILAIKNYIFFSWKMAKIWRILTSFSDCYKKSARAKTAADWGHTGWCFLKIENLPNFVKLRQFFKKSNFSKLLFVPTMNDLILE